MTFDFISTLFDDSNGLPHSGADERRDANLVWRKPARERDEQNPSAFG
jgi:hypothetical protein